MHESFPWPEECLIDDEPERDDDQHDPDHLIHGAQLAAVVKRMAEAEAGQDGDVDLGRPSASARQTLSPASFR